MLIWLIIGGFAIIGGLVSRRLKSKFAFYSQVPMTQQMSGVEVAQRMMADFGISDVKIVQGKGFLSDHYNPATKTVSLSPDVYQGRSVAAAAVAAHECGHVVQHAKGYAWLQFRSKMVPVVQLASRAQGLLMGIVVMGAFGGMGGGGDFLALILLASVGLTTLFALVTLPVEFDASNRALTWLEKTGLTRGEKHEGAKDALWWAAMTYVVSALSSLTLFLYLLMSRQQRR